MSNFEKGEFYFGISDKKIHICFFEEGKNVYKENLNFEEVTPTQRSYK